MRREASPADDAAMGDTGASPLELCVEASAQHRAVVVFARGDLDIESAPSLRELLAELIQRGDVEIVVDVGDVAFMDSTGLGVLVGAVKRARGASGNLVLRRPTRHIRRVLEVTGLTRVFGEL